MGKPPHFLFPGATKPGKWTAKAKLLLEAFQVYDDSLCGSCRQSAFHALNIANSREFGVDSVTCLGCEVLDAHKENHKDDKPMAGERVFVVNTMGPTSGLDVPS